jgi:thymidylate synthase
LVFKPLGLEIEEIICHSTSAHIYNNDMPQVIAGLKGGFGRLLGG